MLDFTVDSPMKINVFTNIQWIKEKYKESYFKFLESPEESDICIVDSRYESNNVSGLKINIDKCDDEADAFIPENYIEAYLDLLQKFDPDICSIGMADITDIMGAAKGTLVEYMKIDITSDNELEYISEFNKSLKGGAFKGSAVLFVSEKDYVKLNNYGNVLEELYENIDIVMFAPSGKNKDSGRYAEVFIFKWEGEDINE